MKACQENGLSNKRSHPKYCKQITYDSIINTLKRIKPNLCNAKYSESTMYIFSIHVKKLFHKYHYLVGSN